MTIKHFNFRVPPGMVVQPFADGSYNLVYDDSKTVILRDFFATCTNTLTTTAVQYLERKEADEKRLVQERAERTKVVSKTVGIVKEKDRIKQTMPLMGTEEVPTGTVLDKIPALVKVKKPLVVEKPNRFVNTNKGQIEVAADVSDADIRNLGYVIINETESDPDPVDLSEIEPDTLLVGESQQTNGHDASSATDVEPSDSPLESAS